MVPWIIGIRCRSVDSQDLNIAQNAVGVVRINALPLSIAQKLALILTGPCHSEIIPIILFRQVLEMSGENSASALLPRQLVRPIRRAPPGFLAAQFVYTIAATGITSAYGADGVPI
jgi:hypothetical protein